MTEGLSRRLMIAGLLASAATGACANAPERSLRPPARPASAVPGAAPDADALVSAAKLGGAVGFLVADADSGRILEAHGAGQALAPASIAKIFTTLYALDGLGVGHRFATSLVAAGRISGKRLDGDLVLAGGGDPTLDTEGLAALAADLRAAGISEVTGRLRYWGGALPALFEITSGQPGYLGYNPAISGLNLNFNRVYFEWKRQGKGYAVSMDARSGKRRPAVAVARMSVASRNAPLYTWRDGDDAELWTVAQPALGKGGGRWLPVRHPARYAGDVFRTLAAAQGVKIGGIARAERLAGGTVLATHQSEPLRDVAREMLLYSTNLTAEVLGLGASRQASLGASAAQMCRFLGERYGAGSVRMVDHSGLGEASRVTPAEMVSVLAGKGARAALQPILKKIPLRDARGKPLPDSGIEIRAKTGTLNFVSCLAGYATSPGGRVLAFAILSGDLARRSALDDEAQDRPAGAGPWNVRAKALQQGLIERWVKLYGA